MSTRSPDLSDEYDDELVDAAESGYWSPALVQRREENAAIEEALWKQLETHLEERKGYERDVQNELAEEIADLRDDLLIATPSRLAVFLTPKVFGNEATFTLDPWIAKLEQRVVTKLRTPQREYLGVNAVPQAGKTTYCGLWVPFWIAGWFPDKRQMKIAYSESLAAQTGKVLRDLVKLYGPTLFGINVDPDNEKVTDWTLLGRMGGVLSAGLGGSITGRSGDFIQIDDLIKNMQEAGSKSTKDYIEREYFGTIRPRLQPGGMILLSATRYAGDDLSGRIKDAQRDSKYEGDDWEWLKFDAIATPERGDPLRFEDSWRDCIGRRKGEPLRTRHDAGRDFSAETPEQWQDSALYQMKRTLASDIATWSAVYQQEPTNPTGGMFPEAKWLYYDPDPAKRGELPSFIGLRRVWDLAATEGGGDWTVGGLVGKTADGDFYVLDLTRFQEAADGVQRRVRQTLASDGFAVPIMVEEEKGGSGKHNTAFFTKELAPAHVKPALPQGSKEDRARPYSSLQQTGHIFLPKSADDAEVDWTPDWLQIFIDEHAAMMGDGRSGRHDDIVDVVAHAINDMLLIGETEIRESGVRDWSQGMALASELGARWSG